MDADNAFIDPALRLLPTRLSLQQDQPLYNFGPVITTPLAPLAPTAPYQIATGGKLNKDSIVHEFVLVKTKIQQLEHNLQLTKNENIILQTLLTCRQAENELRFQQVQKTLEDHLEQCLEQCWEQFQATQALHAINLDGSTDSSSSEDEDISAKKKKLAVEAKEAKLSIVVSKHAKILHTIEHGIKKRNLPR